MLAMSSTNSLINIFVFSEALIVICNNVNAVFIKHIHDSAIEYCHVKKLIDIIKMTKE